MFVIHGSELCSLGIRSRVCMSSKRIRTRMSHPRPLRMFDVVLAVGTAGGEVLLLDLCLNLVDEVVTGVTEVKDEVNPSQVSVITKRKLIRIEYQKEVIVQNQQQLAIHLNDFVVWSNCESYLVPDGGHERPKPVADSRRSAQTIQFNSFSGSRSTTIHLPCRTNTAC